MVLDSFQGHCQAKHLRSVLGKFLRPYYLFRYFSFKINVGNPNYYFFFILTYILSIISTSHSNSTFLQLLLISLIPSTFVFELLPAFVRLLASLVGPFPIFLFPLLIFSPENRRKTIFIITIFSYSTYVC